MKRNILLWSAAGFSFATLGGTILHFLFDWTDGSILVAPFSGVNESTWEHMKLLYWPLLLFTIVQHRFCNWENYWCVKLVGTLAGLMLIPVLFFTIRGIFGPTPDWINIGIFYVTAACVYALEGWMYSVNWPTCHRTWLALSIMLAVGILFVIFTFETPQIPLFQDPLTGSYGL